MQLPLNNFHRIYFWCEALKTLQVKMDNEQNRPHSKWKNSPAAVVSGYIRAQSNQQQKRAERQFVFHNKKRDPVLQRWESRQLNTLAPSADTKLRGFHFNFETLTRDI